MKQTHIFFIISIKIRTSVNWIRNVQSIKRNENNKIKWWWNTFNNNNRNQNEYTKIYWRIGRLLFTKFHTKKKKQQQMTVSNFVVFHYVVCLAAALSHLLIEWYMHTNTQSTVHNPQSAIRVSFVLDMKMIRIIVHRSTAHMPSSWLHTQQTTNGAQFIIIAFSLFSVGLLLSKWNWNFEWSMLMAYISLRDTF